MLDEQEICESAKAIEAEETDSGNKMNDDEDDVVLFIFFFSLL